MEELNIKDKVIEEGAELVAQESGKSFDIKKLAIGIGIAVVTGVGAGLYKNRKRFNEFSANRLRKKGYVVITPEEMDDVEEIETSIEPID